MTYRNRQSSIVFAFTFALALIVATLSQLHAQTLQKSPGLSGSDVLTPKTAPKLEPKVPSELAPETAPQIEGFVAQGDVLRAKPGYVLEKGQDDQVVAKPARAGGGLSTGGTATCSCSGEGNCDWTAEDDVAICHKSTTLPCTGSCAWDTVVGSGQIKIQ